MLKNMFVELLNSFNKYLLGSHKCQTEESEWIGPARFRRAGSTHCSGDKKKDNELVEYWEVL